RDHFAVVVDQFDPDPGQAALAAVLVPVAVAADAGVPLDDVGQPRPLDPRELRPGEDPLAPEAGAAPEPGPPLRAGEPGRRAGGAARGGRAGVGAGGNRR